MFMGTLHRFSPRHSKMGPVGPKIMSPLRNDGKNQNNWRRGHCLKGVGSQSRLRGKQLGI